MPLTLPFVNLPIYKCINHCSRADIKPLEAEETLKKSPSGNVVPGRIARRAKRQISAPPSMGEGEQCLFHGDLGDVFFMVKLLQSKAYEI